MSTRRQGSQLEIGVIRANRITTLARPLLLACHAAPTPTPTPTPTAPPLAPIELPATVEQGPLLAREFTLDRQRLAAAMAEQIGHDIGLLGHAELPTSHLPHREIVVFTVDGTDHCEHYLRPKPPHARHELGVHRSLRLGVSLDHVDDRRKYDGDRPPIGGAGRARRRR